MHYAGANCRQVSAAACAWMAMESSTGSGESSAPISSSISVHASTTACAPASRRAEISATNAARLASLVGHIRDVLVEAIAAGGSSLRDHRQATGELGYFQHSFRVYGREGAPCPSPGCPGTVARIVQSGRSSFFCPVCQT